MATLDKIIQLILDALSTEIILRDVRQVLRFSAR